MGSRDYNRGEKKKPKKDAKKAPVSMIFQEPRPEVEVIRKGKKARGAEEE
jgi:hypothetical protein